jgi:site-specific DNA-methyltransferase (adenine-specific)/site-specific DNA-methyltransferase (cytosine-N4-specific)
MIQFGDARNLPFQDESFNAVITSPPYWGLRTYGHDEREIGGGSLTTYLQDVCAVADEIWRVLRTDGVFWLNIADTASGSGGAGGDYNSGGKQHGRPKWKQGDSGLPGMTWCNVPSRVSIMLQDRGWLLRSDITWNKQRLRPESLAHARRPGVQTERIFMFAKHRDHVFYPDGLIERGNIWSFPPEKKAKSHLAPFPIELPTRCLLCSTRPGDRILDPFIGKGTTIEAAENHGRIGYGLDLYSGDYE